MSPDQSTLYSQGFNFTSFIQKGVDPRTGQYTCTIALYKAPAQARNCPPLNLSITYDPLNSQDVGIGTGWSFNLSSYQHRARYKRLLLSTGEHYQVTETSSYLGVNDQKLKSFLFKKKGTDYQVIHKSGEIETLSNANNTYNTTVPVELHAVNGRSLKLVWTRSLEQPRLCRIEDGPEVLLQIDYGDPYVKITRAPNTSESSTFTLVRRNNRLVELHLPLDDSPSWKFSYESYDHVTCLTSVTSPSGLQEEVHHQGKGHRLPPGAPYPTIPYVISHTVHPGNQQPSIKAYYSYSEHNFLGYGGVSGWDDGQDNLYRVQANYQYTSSVQVDGGPTTKYTYNKFHLIVSTQQQHHTKQITQKITYYAAEHISFEKQPAQYQLPRSIEMTYKDTATQSSRTETVQHIFDEWGNPTQDIQKTGVKTDRTYYPAAGETDPHTGEILCPADPHGFQRYVKEETATPAVNASPTPTRSKYYTYHELPTADNALVDYFVAVHQAQYLEDGQRVSSEESTYFNQPATRDHGRLQQRTTRIFDQYPTTCDLTYGYPSAEQWTQTTRITSFDGHTVQEETSSSLASGLILSQTDQNDISTHFQYDKLGRQIKATVAPGTVYEATERHEYVIPEGSIGYLLTETDSKGVQTRYTTDGLHRVVRIERQDDDGQRDAKNNTYSGTFRAVQERNYNTQGQCIEVVGIDWLRTNGGEPTEQRNSRQLEYDDWGHVCKVTQASGLVTSTVMDPIDMTSRKCIAGEGTTETQLNLFGAPIQTVLLTRDGTVYSTANNTYDGLGRLVKTEDNLGRTTEYQYDCFDRIIQTTWPDDRTIDTQYAAHSTAVLPESITTKNRIVGTQSFDGLARIGRRTVGGRTIEQSYQGNAPHPYEIITPRGEQHLTYVPFLDYALKSMVSNDDTNTYQYDNQTTRILESKNDFSTRDLQYLPSGLVQRESMQIQGGASFSAQSTYSMAGKLQSYTNVHGQKHETQYDRFGRPQRLAQGNLTVNLTYDQASHLSESCVQDEAANLNLTTSFSYDDFGREVERTVSNGQETLYRVSQTYDKASLITTRRLEDGETNVLRHESFQYDSHSRLTGYQCQGSQPPTDEQGHPLQSQQFSFDDFENLVQVSTIFQGGSENIARYTYSDEDPTQLIRITNTHPDYPATVDLAYDQNGCLTRDEQGRILGYDGMNRLSTVHDAHGQLLSQYLYDAAGKLVCQNVPGKPDTHLHYRGDTLIAVTEGDSQVSYLSGGTGYWGQTCQKDGQTQTQLWASDSHQSPLAWLDSQQPGQIHLQKYTPYGGSQGGPSIGFQGQWRDPVTGWYHLGNGYRVYNPVLMRFHTPDAWCPFTSGEINPYAYCLGDPINRADPSGHFSIFGINFGGRDWAILGVGLLVGIGVGILTGGAGFAIEAGLGIAAGVVSDVVTGAAYDAIADHKAPTWKSIGSDALFGAIGGLLGEGIGRVLGKGIEIGALGIKKLLGRAGSAAITAAERESARGFGTLATVLDHNAPIAFLDSVGGRPGRTGFLTHGHPDGFLLGRSGWDRASIVARNDILPALQNLRATHPNLQIDDTFHLFACYGFPRNGRDVSRVLGLRVRCAVGPLAPNVSQNVLVHTLEQTGGVSTAFPTATFRRIFFEEPMDTSEPWIPLEDMEVD